MDKNLKKEALAATKASKNEIKVFTKSEHPVNDLLKLGWVLQKVVPVLDGSGLFVFTLSRSDLKNPQD